MGKVRGGIQGLRKTYPGPKPPGPPMPPGPLKPPSRGNGLKLKPGEKVKGESSGDVTGDKGETGTSGTAALGGGGLAGCMKGMIMNVSYQ